MQSTPTFAEQRQTTHNNALILSEELSWLQGVIQTRIAQYLKQDSKYTSIADIAVPDLSSNDSRYAELVQEMGLTRLERLVVLLALAPYFN